MKVVSVTSHEKLELSTAFGLASSEFTYHFGHTAEGFSVTNKIVFINFIISRLLIESVIQKYLPTYSYTYDRDLFRPLGSSIL